MDTQNERGLTDYAPQLNGAADSARNARRNAWIAAGYLRQLAEHITGASLDGVYTGDQLVMASLITQADLALSRARESLATARETLSVIDHA
jgi:hypothetical protein